MPVLVNVTMTEEMVVEEAREVRMNLVLLRLRELQRHLGGALKAWLASFVIRIRGRA